VNAQLGVPWSGVLTQLGVSWSGVLSDHDGLGRWCRSTYRSRVVYPPNPERLRPPVRSYPPFAGGLPPVCRSFKPRLRAVYPLRTSLEAPFAPVEAHYSGREHLRFCGPLRARNEFEPVASRTTGTPPADDTSTAGSSPSRCASCFWLIASWETRVAPGGSGVKAAQRARGRSPLCANKERAARPSFLGARSGPPTFLDTYEVTRPTQDRCVRRNQ
jgi:hypothetical protein